MTLYRPSTKRHPLQDVLPPPPGTGRAPTGRSRHRAQWLTGKLILQIELGNGVYRDARVDDLILNIPTPEPEEYFQPSDFGLDPDELAPPPPKDWGGATPPTPRED